MAFRAIIDRLKKRRSFKAKKLNSHLRYNDFRKLPFFGDISWITYSYVLISKSDYIIAKTDSRNLRFH